MADAKVPMKVKRVIGAAVDCIDWGEIDLAYLKLAEATDPIRCCQLRRGVAIVETVLIGSRAFE